MQRFTGNRGAGTGAVVPMGAPTPTAGTPAFWGTAGQPAIVNPPGPADFDSGPPPDAATGCAATSVSAPPASVPKVDIVWVVDASGSMLDEQIKIGMNLTQFADKITKASLDVHIVMMTTSAAIPVICPVTSPDPLAGTALAGDPRYRFLESLVDSNNPLDIAVRNYPMYSNFLRADAATHFVFVTDDESRYKGMPTPEGRAQTFYTDMKALLGRDFTQHTIASDGPLPCSDLNCMPDINTGICVFVMLGCGAAAPGATYYALAAQTKGLTASICESNWTPIFDKLSEAVIKSAPLPCNYVIPPPPAGQNLDPTKVNVNWLAPGTTQEQLFRKARDQAACGSEIGWYYDNPSTPKEVLLCPAACKQVAAGGTLGLAFGCETIVVPI